ncbi:NAD(P)-dependent oxidoreductase [Bradyrhizobium sp. SYSU BS000235]|uniref:NAD(P)-dependent oxidoreductase n=1 Tax=Bradyrhizobium sp. SYSU BS000235 TaxID=3411332 RepID=UPI003C77E096
MNTPTCIGFIGVGAIGARMAARARHHGIATLAYDIDQATLAAVSKAGTPATSSAADLAARCDVIVTCVTDPQAVEAALTGARGVAEAAQAGTLVIETTTSTPDVTRKVAAALAKKGVRVVDAPVSRGVPAAETGTLSIMAGGADSDLDDADHVLRLFGTDIIRTGALGTGHVAKALNMSVLGSNFIALAEAMTIGMAMGFEQAKLHHAIEASDAASFVSANHYPKYVLTKRFDSRFTLGLMRKDVGIAASIATGSGLFRPFTHRVVDFYDRAVGMGSEADNTLLFAQVEALAGSSKRNSGKPSEPHSEKALILALQATALLATQEAVAIAASNGVAAVDFARVLALSSGASRIAEKCLATAVIAPAGFTVAQAHAATHDVLTSALQRDIPAPVLGLSRDLLAGAVHAGLGTLDAAELWPSIAAGHPPTAHQLSTHL